MSNYQPKRATARWLEGARPYVLSVHDSGPSTNDRYTVFFGWPLWQPSMGRSVPYLAFNDTPTSPNAGVSQWGEAQSQDRDAAGKKIRWLDLPEELRKHVTARVESGHEPIVVVSLTKAKAGWQLASVDGNSPHGASFDTKAQALQYAHDNCLVIVSQSDSKI